MTKKVHAQFSGEIQPVNAVICIIEFALKDDGVLIKVTFSETKIFGWLTDRPTD
jgi:hypothetical protein